MISCLTGCTGTSRWPLLACVLALAGCTSLLPRSEEMTQSPWQSYQEAQSAFDKIIPGQTTLAELKALKLDPESNPNIAILNYQDVLKRFLLNPSLTTRDLDRAVAQCIAAKTACLGYEVNKRVVKKHRNGSFFADFLGFRRTTHIEGWKFNGLVLIKDGVVVYKLTGGQPAIAEYEQNHNPLGPLQSVGMRAFSWILPN
jgi:hypothetical protein